MMEFLMMTVLFYGAMLCFAVTIAAWCVNVWLNKWQAGVLVGAASVLGAAVLLVQLVLCCINNQGISTGGICSMIAFTLALSACYMHFRLMGTGVAPVAAMVIILIEMAGRFAPDLNVMLPLVSRLDAPWIKPACVLAAVGMGLAVAYLILGLIYVLRKHRQTEETGEIAQFVTEAMPKMVSHFGWWALMVLSFSLGAYLIWCQTLFGMTWIWQPFFGVLAFVWIVVFLAKDVLMMR